MNNHLPKPSINAIAQSNQLTQLIKIKIENQGAISFADYMDLALYTPGLGYYSSTLQKFGPTGDFITAPEISPLFGECLASGFDSILENFKNPIILELGAGSGKLAADILKNLKSPIQYYFIFEISQELRIKQQETLKNNCPEQFHLVRWLDALPSQPITGIIFGNEIIDALPVTCFEKQNNSIFERRVNIQENAFIWENCPASPELESEIKALAIQSDFYQSEINLSLKTWLSSLNNCLNQGCMLFIDYGFPEREYYHPQRSMGTLMCHYQHFSHGDPFFYPGLQDITAHVNFTQIAMIADELGLSIEGYCNQASFLIDNGIEKFATNLNVTDSKAIQKLLFPQEMGELFKVIFLGKNYLKAKNLIQTDFQHRL